LAAETSPHRSVVPRRPAGPPDTSLQGRRFCWRGPISSKPSMTSAEEWTASKSCVGTGDHVEEGDRIANVTRPRPNSARMRAGGFEFSAAPVGSRHSGEPVQRPRGRNQLQDSRYPQDYSWPAGLWRRRPPKRAEVTNHRMGLYDAILIKNQHIAAAGGVRHAIGKCASVGPADRDRSQDNRPTQRSPGLRRRERPGP